MFSEEKTFKQSLTAIREKGYDGADATIRMFATRERKIMKETPMKGRTGEKIERKWLVSLLYHPIDEVTVLNQEQLDRILVEYLMIGRIYHAITGFKQVLFDKKRLQV